MKKEYINPPEQFGGFFYTLLWVREATHQAKNSNRYFTRPHEQSCKRHSIMLKCAFPKKITSAMHNIDKTYK
ncbi:hypothetical protein DHW03_08710 [Pedobacter yonginense]|uniref:Uncharacterized protein n=1 Tax=Pedobacter yonginense TaxID=651869 RepID=A0A317ENA5_9SPHI|nr:hypothetical protein DHW03_08710 [Pedobacter yonginense]